MYATSETEELLITNDGIKYAGIYTSQIKNTSQRKRAFATIVVLDALADYLLQKNLEVSVAKTLFKISDIAEKYEISDLYVNNWRIDVRLLFNEDFFLIPKSHVDNDILPDFYAVIKVNKELTNAEFIGYINPNDTHIQKEQYNNLYYKIDCSYLKNMHSFVKTLTKKNKIKLINSEHEQFKDQYLSCIDDENDDETKIKILRHVLKCLICRSELVNFSGFEIIAKNSNKYTDLFQDKTLNIIGTSDINSPQYANKPEEIIDISQEENNTNNSEILQDTQDNNNIVLNSDTEVNPITSNNNSENTEQELTEETADDNDDNDDNDDDIIDELFDFSDDEDEQQDENNSEEKEQLSNETINISDNSSEILQEDEIKEIEEEGILLSDNNNDNLLNLNSEVEELVETEAIELQLDENKYEEDEQLTTQNNTEITEQDNDEIAPKEDFNENVDIQYISDEVPTDNIISTNENDLLQMGKIVDYDEFGEPIYENQQTNNEIEFISEDNNNQYSDENTSSDEYNINIPQNQSEIETIDNITDNYTNNNENVDTDVMEQENGIEQENPYELPDQNKKQFPILAIIIPIILVGVIIGAIALYNSNAQKNAANNINPVEQAMNETSNTSNDFVPDIQTENNQQNNSSLDITQSSSEDNNLTPQIPIQQQNSNENKPTINETADINNVVSNALSDTPQHTTVSAVSWLCKSELFGDTLFKAYLESLDDAFKLNIRKNILSATELATNQEVSAELIVDNTNAIKNIRISTGSGSSEIDNIVLQSIKETLTYVNKPQFTNQALNTDKYYLKVIIKL